MQGHEWYRLLLLFQPVELLFREGLSISTKMAFPSRRKMIFNSSTSPRRIFRSDRRMRLQSPGIAMAERSPGAVEMGVWVESVFLSDGHATSSSVNGM
ncbi:hypothetical protein GQ457_15G022430 [Hibiscus cannabinus]